MLSYTTLITHKHTCKNLHIRNGNVRTHVQNVGLRLPLSRVSRVIYIGRLVNYALAIAAAQMAKKIVLVRYIYGPAAGNDG